MKKIDSVKEFVRKNRQFQKSKPERFVFRPGFEHCHHEPDFH